jgi:glycosyltransferase involved in cell wall biosynthesis
MISLNEKMSPKETWIALLGRRDKPTDGVEDYCTFLSRALDAKGIELKLNRVPWIEKGWIGALRWLAHESVAWRGKWVIVQYTALSWSRRGFPFLAIAVLAVLRRGGARVAVMFHEPTRQKGPRRIDRARGASQDWVIRKAYREAAKSIFAEPIETITWLPTIDSKAAFIPIGANIPECVTRRRLPSTNEPKTVIVFGVTGMPETVREVEEIVWVMREASAKLAKLRLVVVGRGALEARDQLVKALHGSGVEVVVRGVLPAEEIAREFAGADALLFLRGVITAQRGSAMAGIASGVPVVGYRGGSVTGSLAEAGIEWSPSGDRDGLARGLVRVLSDPVRWAELHERNLELQKNRLSWDQIARQFREALPE